MEILKDEKLRWDIAELLRQFMHSGKPLAECSQMYRDSLLNSATFIMQLVESHGYKKEGGFYDKNILA